MRAVRLAFRVGGALLPRLAARVAERLFTTPRRTGRPLSAPARELAARAAPLEVEHEGRVLRGLAWGEGPVVLLVHGWEARWSSMAALVAPLVERGFRVVAFDSPAHGASAGRSTDAVDCGRALATIARCVGPIHAVVAHSFGGAAVLFMLAGRCVYPWEAPPVSRVALIASPSDVRDVVAEFVRMVGLPGRAALAFRARVQRRVGLPESACSLSEAAGELRIPFLVVHDRGDASIPFSCAEELVRAQPRARLLATDGLGHNRILREPAVVEQVAAFVGERAGARGLESVSPCTATATAAT